MNMLISAFVCTHVGKVRKNNEDNFFLQGLTLDRGIMNKGLARSRESAEAVQLYAVCDGMGGQAAGEEASLIGVSLLRPLLAQLCDGGAVRACVNRYADDANKAVVALPTDSGSTLVMLIINNGFATVAWLGDSRAYMLRDRRLIRLTEDHTEAERMKKLGITPKGGRASNSLTRYLGMDMQDLVITPSYTDDIRLKRKDVFLLCSDGLYNMVDEDKISDILIHSDSPARELAEAALENGGTDNITALVADVSKLSKPLFGAK